MPPVRWKFLYFTVLTLVQLLIFIDAQHMQDTVPISSDGWRPIVGTRRQPPFGPEIQTSENTHYKNPSHNAEVDIVKAETPVLSQSTTPPKLPTKLTSAGSVNNNINGATFHKQGGKIPPHAKFTSPGPYHTIPTKAHGLHVPIGANNGRPGQFGHIQKRPPNKPPPGHLGPNFKRKPVRGLATAHSNREEVFVRPPSAASFSSFTPLPSNVKTRETQGLEVPGANQFSIKPSSQIDFSSGFILPPPTDNFQQFKSHPVTYIFSQSLPQANEVRFQNDDYTRNLVPPPLLSFQQDKGKFKQSKVKDSPVTEPIIKLSELNNNLQQFGLQAPQFQENLVPQLPPPFEQNFSFQKPFTKPREDAVDVQVTKEKLQVFHSNAPLSYSPNDYVDYDFHSVKKPQQLPKLQTYEVTEGKWADNPNPFIFNFADSQPVMPQKLIRLSTARPQLISEPTVVLNVPPFLPTPYKPDGVVPTSPTQSEASTVFTKVSSKMNRYKNEALTTNPLFFDVKEVSTHYPILGKPAPVDSTMDANGELSNEITTLKQQQNFEAIEATMVPTTKRTKTRRRRPQPRRPTTTTTTTTTTDEPLMTESLDQQKPQENYEESSMETERPLRRQRPRPNRYRTSSSSESEERPSHHKTTTPLAESEESTEKRVRGRHRYRQRGYGTKIETRPSSTRRRIRPANTEMPPNHKMMETDVATFSDEATEATMETQPAEHETQGIFETKYPQESSQSIEEAKINKVEFELPGRHYEPSQYEEESKYETTVVSNDVSSIQKPSQEDSDLVATQRVQEEASSSGTSESEKEANIHLPENEIDYSTPSVALEQDNDHVQTTMATTLPTTITVDTTTTKSHRIRGRPIKYGSSNRPRFSVKDYRQRLNQYTSTTPSTTTDFMKTTPEGIRFRFPSRKLRTRPTSKTTTTTDPSYEIEEDQTEPIRRGGFKPKEPRHGVATTEAPYDNIITEKNIKSINTRLRPFGRYKSTTESTSMTPKVSIKPNLFSARRRLPPPNLRMKILNKFNKNVTEETTTYGSEDEITEPVTAQMTETEDESVIAETSTEPNKMRNTETTTEFSESTTVDVSEDDYSQRVSELTSSFKNQYETPGLFKSVSPTSRRIPNYFTLSTEDPILPIEAFFPNLKEKGQ